MKLKTDVKKSSDPLNLSMTPRFSNKGPSMKLQNSGFAETLRGLDLTHHNHINLQPSGQLRRNRYYTVLSQYPVLGRYWFLYKNISD